MGARVGRGVKVVLLVVAAILVGCTTRLAYNNLDLWLSFRIDDYINMTSEQEDRLDSDLSAALERHRAQQLPKIHRALDQLQADVQLPMNYGHMGSYYRLFTGLGQDSVAVLAMPLANLLRDLDESQVNGLYNKMRERFAKLDAERAAKSPSQRLTQRTQRLTEFAQKWVGSLTPRQRQLIAELAGYQVEMTPVFVSLRDQYFKDFQQLMLQRRQPGFEAKLARLMRQMVSLEGPSYQSEVRFYLNRRFELLTRLNHTLSDSQRQRATGKLVDLRKDTALLINQ